MNEPPRLRRTMPVAVVAASIMPMTVSLAAPDTSIKIFIATAISTAKIIIAGRTSIMPKTIPMAIPASDECPITSEKNASLFATTMVPASPKHGVTTRTASRAFFMNM